MNDDLDKSGPKQLNAAIALDGAKGATPTYEADDGPLSQSDLLSIREVAATRLPNGKTVSKRSLI